MSHIASPRDRAVERIHQAVQEAVDAGMTPQEFVRSAWQSWMQELTDKRRYVGQMFEEMLP